MPRVRLVVFWLVCLGAGLGIVRFAPVAVAAWQSRRHALRLESIRVTADSQGTAGLFPVIEITLRNLAPSLSFLTRLGIASPACGLAPATRPARPVRVHRTRLPRT